MRTNTHTNFVVAFLLLAVFALACSSDDETKKANEFIDKANKTIETANEASQKGGKRVVEMEGMIAEIKSESDLARTRDVARDCKELFTKARDAYKEASEGFSSASKLKVHEKFKEYTETKASELTTRSEMMSAGIDEAQALIDSENRQDYKEKVKSIVKRFTEAKEKAEELTKKGDKIFADNKEIFREEKK